MAARIKTVPLSGASIGLGSAAVTYIWDRKTVNCLQKTPTSSPVTVVKSTSDREELTLKNVQILLRNFI